MVTVNKDALVREIVAKTNMPIFLARQALEVGLAAIRERAEAGDTIRIAGFGSFQVKARLARTGRNPATGEAMQIPETRRLTFKAFKAS